MAYEFKSCVPGQEVLKSPMCPVCTSPFDNDKHLAKILQCAHTVCETCVSLLEEQYRQLNRFVQDPAMVSIRCPTCRTVTQVPRAYFRSNYQLMDVVDTMRNEAHHSVSFLLCTECSSVFHEKDMNICTKCATIFAEPMTSAQLVENGIRIEQFAICSTCFLSKHSPQGHSYLNLMPMRVEIQRSENSRCLKALKERLLQTQRAFRERLEKRANSWMTSNSTHEMALTQFRTATSSYEQKRLFDHSVNQLKSETEQIEMLTEQVQKWSDALEQGLASRNANSIGTRPERPPTPIPVENHYVYYFEH